MSKLDVVYEVLSETNLEGLSDNLEIVPFSIKEIFVSLVINFLYIEVGIIRVERSRSPCVGRRTSISK